MTKEIETDVLIVGGGPTGLALAIGLQQQGIRHMVIEKENVRHGTSRAAVIHAHTLEMLQGLGVTESLVKNGLKLTRFALRDRDRSLISLNFSDLPSAHNYILMIPQDKTEEMLEERLVALGGRLRRGTTATQFIETLDGVATRVITPEGEQTIRARNVVGADGAKSRVREAAGIAFAGGDYGESLILGDARVSGALRREEVNLFLSTEGLVVVAPLPNGAYRIVATLENAPERPGAEIIQAILDARGPRGRCKVEEVIWSSRFRLHHRVASTYRKGPFVLMGDAAHVHSPAGGQGMNTGLVDATVLSDALGRLLKGGESDVVLDQYGALRRPAAQEVMDLAGRLTEIATMDGAFKTTLRNALMSMAGALPPFRKRLELNLSGLSRTRYTKLAA